MYCHAAYALPLSIRFADLGPGLLLGTVASAPKQVGASTTPSCRAKLWLTQSQVSRQMNYGTWNYRRRLRVHHRTAIVQVAALFENLPKTGRERFQLIPGLNKSDPRSRCKPRQLYHVLPTTIGRAQDHAHRESRAAASGCPLSSREVVFRALSQPLADRHSHDAARSGRRDAPGDARPATRKRLAEVLVRQAGRQARLGTG